MNREIIGHDIKRARNETNYDTPLRKKKKSSREKYPIKETQYII